MIARRVFLAGIGAVLAGPALAQRRPAANPRRVAGPGDAAARAIAASGLGGEVAFVLADAATGAVIAARGADRPLPPASTMKALTAIYAMGRLGGEARLRTRLIATGPVVAGRIEGDLILAGGGDPVLDSDDLAALAADLAAAGVRGVTGRFLTWDGALPARDQIAPGQPVHASYDPAISGLMLNFNRVHLEWRRVNGDYNLSLDARAEAHVPAARTVTARVAPRDLPLFTYDGAGPVEGWTVARSALGRGGARWLPVRRPAAYAGDVFRSLAQAQGVTLPVSAPAPVLHDGAEIAGHDSPPLHEMLAGMLRYSTNLTAEALGLAASGASDQSASAAAMRAWLWHHAPLGPAELTDHSGLGPQSWITAAGMAQALALAGPGAGLPGLLHDHPLPRAVGARDRLPGVTVRAKTGTLNFVSNLVGFLTPQGRAPMVFVILTADMDRRAAVMGSPLDLPAGVEAWTRRSKALQDELLRIWAG
ncbi:D-alanyl-D-alanine carboxypeptidase/D-alanyl-D-alanine-endopeptidase [Paracoccus sp. p3-h83]|uniref:D-alanyl-D-alanine carboxypeptidase/D-alanyl-D-alanine endopeptidase n=1 Tax=Paracoccus sp. p3-h83 TaxID=3342805 RepID=UPI0035B7C0A3